jgi:methyltransferase (TIGR00027 family)
LVTNTRDARWSAVNRTAQSVAAMRLLEALIRGQEALIRDRCIPLLLPDGRFEHEALADIRVPDHIGGDLARIAEWVKAEDGDPSATRLGIHIDRLALRTAKIDALLQGFLREVKQLVIVGAGLDTRAFNLSGASDVAVFEADFPHVLAFKSDRLGAMSTTFRTRTEIGCDVTSEAFAELLLSNAFDPTQSTVWLMEGLLVYLSGDQIAALNRTVRSLSAPGSRLIATFLGRNAPETFSQGMVSRFDDSPSLLATYGWQARQLHYAEIAREYSRPYPADYDVYLTYTEPLTAR